MELFAAYMLKLGVKRFKADAFEVEFHESCFIKPKEEKKFVNLDVSTPELELAARKRAEVSRNKNNNGARMNNKSVDEKVLFHSSN